MVRPYKQLIIAAAVFSLISLAPSFAENPMTYIYNGPESSLDVRYSYQWEILRAALERTSKKYGPYRMTPSVTMSERRQVFELKNATGRLTVMYLDSTPEHERDLLPVRIPVDKNLVGYRIFLIRKEDQAKFRSIKSLADLKKFTFGLGSDWIDVRIFRANHFKVVTGSNYDGLFHMLINKRFDIFSRGANEVMEEYVERKSQMPDLQIEETMMLYYPAPMYFWFSRSQEGEALARRVREGMTGMIADGTYDKIFKTYYGRAIEGLDLKHRKIFRITNPFLVPETPLKDKRLWFYPQTYR
jgi:ABC-type amino acid transport substrate-binding protein